jgi:hypothetical protein
MIQESDSSKIIIEKSLHTLQDLVKAVTAIGGKKIKMLLHFLFLETKMLQHFVETQVHNNCHAKRKYINKKSMCI